MDQVISKQQLAKELGVTAARVSQLVARGLPVRADRQLNRLEALSWVSQNVDRSNPRSKPAPAGAMPAAAPTVFAESSRAPQANPAHVLLVGRARVALAHAKRAERLEKLAAGELLDRAEVAKFIATSFTMIRDGLLSLPDRLAGVLAGVDETAEVRRMLMTDVRALLEKLARQVKDAGYQA